MHRPILIAVLDSVQAIFGRGERAERVVDEVLRHRPKWGARDRRLFANTVYELVRWWRREAWRAGVAEEMAFGPALNPVVSAFVWAAWWRARGGAVPDFPELAAGWSDTAPIPRDPAAAPAAVAASIPDWLDAAGSAACGTGWPSLRDALNQPADVHLRANSLRATTTDVIAALAREGVKAIPSAAPERRPHALTLTSRHNLAASAAMRAGFFEIQDAGSQEISPFLQARPGETIVDSCAGAGGKALHLAALMENRGRLLAMDVHSWKLDALAERAARAGATIVETHLLTSQADIARHAGTADRLLIDAPCSGLGVLRRHPDSKWKLTPEEVDRLVLRQREILDAHTRMLKPGGTLVYATCSFLPAENSAQVRAFLERQPPGAWSLEEERLLLPSTDRPDANHDAYYMARLKYTP